MPQIINTPMHKAIVMVVHMFEVPSGLGGIGVGVGLGVGVGEIVGVGVGVGVGETVGVGVGVGAGDGVGEGVGVGVGVGGIEAERSSSMLPPSSQLPGCSAV